MSARSEALARRIEGGAAALVAAAEGLTDEQWRTEHPGERRSVGVLVHHVGTAYLGEAGIVQTLASGGGLPEGVNWDAIDTMNAQHASDHAEIDKATAVALIRQNSAVAAEAVRSLTDEQLDRVAPLVLNWNAPLTVQFFIEQHPVAHPWVHLESINEALKRAR